MLETSDILTNRRFYSEIIEDNIELREAYFNRFLEFAKGVDLIFFDPDNGLEVKSILRGKRSSSKYLYWSEVKDSYQAGHSILIYQHFPRMQRESFIRNFVRQCKAMTEVGRIFYYKTGHVVFFLLTQSKGYEIWKPQTDRLVDSGADLDTGALTTAPIEEFKDMREKLKKARK